MGWIGKEERTHKNLESVQQWGGVGQAAKFKLGRVVLWYISISASAEENLLNAAEEGVSQILNRVHHDTTVDGVTWRWMKTLGLDWRQLFEITFTILGQTGWLITFLGKTVLLVYCGFWFLLPLCFTRSASLSRFKLEFTKEPPNCDPHEMKQVRVCDHSNHASTSASRCVAEGCVTSRRCRYAGLFHDKGTSLWYSD